VVDKGHTVVGVAARLELRAGLLYKWVRKSQATIGTTTDDMQAIFQYVESIGYTQCVRVDAAEE
jgi:transposase-like protein